MNTSAIEMLSMSGIETVALEKKELQGPWGCFREGLS
jgi:hypothetical protein